MDFSQIAKNFSTVASSTLYETQTIHAKIKLLAAQMVAITPFVLYYDIRNKNCCIKGDAIALIEGNNTIDWTIPTTGGMPIFRTGFEISSAQRFDGKVVLCSLGWSGAARPKRSCCFMIISNTPMFTPSCGLAGRVGSVIACITGERFVAGAGHNRAIDLALEGCALLHKIDEQEKECGF